MARFLGVSLGLSLALQQHLADQTLQLKTVDIGELVAGTRLGRQFLGLVQHRNIARREKCPVGAALFTDKDKAQLILGSRIPQVSAESRTHVN